ncbi:MAG: hypothetical protein P8O70_16475 [SAR324 cluster bacterium]|nr:hypothetical protein [SAR324 cluster bacterium]
MKYDLCPPKEEPITLPVAKTAELRIRPSEFKGGGVAFGSTVSPAEKSSSEFGTRLPLTKMASAKIVIFFLLQS